MHIHVNPEVDNLTGGLVATKEMLSGITKLATFLVPVLQFSNNIAGFYLSNRFPCTNRH